MPSERNHKSARGSRERPHFIDVTVPVEAGRKIDGIRCRRTLVDLAGILRLPDLRKVVGRAAIRRKLDVQGVDIAIHNAKGRRGLKQLELALVPYRTKDGEVPDVRSDFETWFCRSCSTWDCRDPAPTPQSISTTSDSSPTFCGSESA
jgi:hypothetical protein